MKNNASRRQALRCSRRPFLAVGVLGLLLTLCGCDKTNSTTPASPKPSSTQPTASVQNPGSTPQPSDGSSDGSAGNPQALRDPSLANEKAPDTFKATFVTTKGSFVVQVTRDWAPLGSDRFYNMVKIGYFTDIAFFRAVEGFMVQFGIHGDPKVSAVWRPASIADDPVKQSNDRSYLTFAMAGPDTRTVQLFINYKNNASLDSKGFPPIGKVIQGMEIVDSLYKGYGEGAPNGQGPDQSRIQMEGNAYLQKDFPKLDYIKSAAITP